MTAGRLIFPGRMPVEDANGDRIPGARAYFYQNNTNQLATTYTEGGLSVQATNPVVADGVGVWPAMWADVTTLFTVAITDAAGVPLAGPPWTGISAAIDATLASVDLAAASADAAEAAATIAESSEASATASAAQAAAYAASIVGAPLSATSSSSLTIGSGVQSFRLDQVGKLFSRGETVVIAETSAPTTIQMTGIIGTFDPTTGDMSVTIPVGGTLGAGTHADWTISLGASVVAGVATTRQILTTGLATGGGDLSADRTVNVPAATASDVRTGTDTTKAVTSGALVGAAAFGALTDAATVAWDTAAIGFNAKVIIAGNRLIGAPTNLKDGVTYTLDISQDATGTHVPSWDGIWDWRSSGAPTLSTGANKKDKITAQYSAASGKLEAGFSKSA